MARYFSLLILALQLLSFVPLALFSSPAWEGSPPFSEKTSIPIILSSDNNYGPMMYITLHSILRNANSGTCY
ncbi:MAG: hypothetical protein LBI69_05280, partial [Puniceicoccales bacterium]|nr:hypothetical protein [Puniceicoccales bacterium]